ncbi:uncharacterized protein LOC114465615 [Gouania willdenowi]|uniref:uncharacterized protein LOC114465615 n=1 Tax=Gouania willdenowi TaxID=441366 RepID=UPI00105456E3|nr:uncharacterized protein LOC114465615 [Gouania willdenowi]
MALDNLMGSHGHLNEQYKYQVLLGHLKLPSALHLAKAYMYDTQPYTAALQALQDKYGQPRQLVQSELGAILNSPAIKFSDSEAFDSFALSIQCLVGMLGTLEGPNGFELRCGSHVDRLLSKMPPSFRDSFIEYCLNRGILRTGFDMTYTLPDLAAWLQMKSQAKRLSSRAAALYQHETPKPVKKDIIPHHKEKTTTIFFNAGEPPSVSEIAHSKATFKSKPYCPHCENKDHFLSSCENFKKLSTSEIMKWIRDGNRCFKCGRNHAAQDCNLKRPCKTCKELHLTILHDYIQQIQTNVNMITTPTARIYLDRPNRSQHVMLKVVKVILRNGDRALETYAVLDDGSERSIILPQAVRQLNLCGQPETLYLQTIHQNVGKLQGSSVSFDLSPTCMPSKKYRIHQAFTAEGLNLAEHSYPVAALQQRYKHLSGLPLQPIDRIHPLLLIGSDMPHLLVPIQPVRAGPPGGPIGVCTQLGWSLQGPNSLVQPTSTSQCFRISTVSPATKLFMNVGHLWQVDAFPYSSEKAVTRSKQDQKAMAMLQTSTTRVKVDGVQQQDTPLLRQVNVTLIQGTKDAVLPCLHCIEGRLAKDPERRAEVYCNEIQNLTEPDSWRYVSSTANPADDITRGLTLPELANLHRWHQGPGFLHLLEDHWPTIPSADPESDDNKIKKSAVVANVIILPGNQLPWKELIEATARSLHGAADPQTTNLHCKASDYLAAETALLIKAQSESFLYHKPFIALLTSLEHVAGNIVRCWQITFGPPSSTTTCQVYKRDRSGGKMARGFQPVRWSSLLTRGFLEHSGQLGRSHRRILELTIVSVLWLCR